MFEEHRWALLERVLGEIPSGPSVCCGVWNGGVLGYVASRRPNEANFGFCRFEEGCIEPRAEDGDHLRLGSCASQPFGEILGWFSQHDLPVALMPGDVLKTFFAPEGTALALLDLNLYEPTLHCLKMLQHKMARGGVILVDDYYYPGVCQALDESPFSFNQEAHMGVCRL